jgi:hypothetical protein
MEVVKYGTFETLKVERGTEAAEGDRPTSSTVTEVC